MSQRPSVLNSGAWAAAEAATLAVISFSTLLATAWLLGPVEFGIAATALTVVQLLVVLVGPGLVGGPLIQREDLRQAHVDSVFWAAFVLACVLAVACWLVSGALARRFGQPTLGPVLAVFALMLLPTAYEAVQVALLRRGFGFRRLAIRSFVSRLLGAAVGIGLALAGAGAWSIVAQHLSTVAVSVAMLRAWAPGRIGRDVELRALREVARFSAPATVTEMISAGGPRLLQLVGAMLLGPQGFAFLHLGLRIVETLRETLTDLSNNVALPVFARVQTDQALLARHLLAATQTLSAVAMPAFIGLGVFAALFVPALMGAAWAGTVPVVRVLAFAAAIGFAGALCVPVLWAVGRPALGLAPRVAELVVALGLLAALAPHGPAMAALAWASRPVLEVSFTLWICPRLLPLRRLALARAMALPAVLACGAVLGLLALDRLLPAAMPALGRLAVLAPAGALLTLLVLAVVQPGLVRDVLRRGRRGGA